MKLSKFFTYLLKTILLFESLQYLSLEYKIFVGFFKKTKEAFMILLNIFLKEKSEFMANVKTSIFLILVELL